MSSAALSSTRGAGPRPAPALLRCLQADALKLRHTAALRLLAAAAGLPVLLVFLAFCFYGTMLVKPGRAAWPTFLLSAWHTWAGLVLPLVLLLLATLVVQIEHRATAWKHLYALPVGRGTLLLSKLLLLVGLSLGLQVLYTLLLLLAGLALSWVRPGLGLAPAALPVAALATLLGRTYVATLGLLAVQYVLSVARRSFVVPLALGLAGLILALVLTSLSKAGWLPYADALLTLNTVRATATGLAVAPALASHEWSSLGWALVAGIGGLAWLRRYHSA